MEIGLGVSSHKVTIQQPIVCFHSSYGRWGANLLATKAFWYYFYNFLKYGKILCGSRRTMLNIFIHGKNLFEQDCKGSHVNLAYFDLSCNPAIIGLKSLGKRFLQSSYRYCQQACILTDFETLFIEFNGQLASGWETKELKGIKIWYGNKQTPHARVFSTGRMRSSPLAKNFLIPLHQEKSSQ